MDLEGAPTSPTDERCMPAYRIARAAARLIQTYVSGACAATVVCLSLQCACRKRSPRTYPPARSPPPHCSTRVCTTQYSVINWLLLLSAQQPCGCHPATSENNVQRGRWHVPVGRANMPLAGQIDRRQRVRSKQVASSEYSVAGPNWLVMFAKQ